jgi:hypothetical protein
MRVTEQLQTTEWAMIGSLGNDSLAGVIPAYHRFKISPESASVVPAYNLSIRDACPKTQNYDKGPDRAIRKFDSEEGMSATMSVFKGQYSDHGWAVYITQQKRRYCLLDTIKGGWVIQWTCGTACRTAPDTVWRANEGCPAGRSSESNPAL